jgi:two-component system, HptB-dependent secretion and biofilm response regulator
MNVNQLPDVSEKEQTLTVLVVDDDRTNRLVLNALLTKEGYNLLQAANGIEAVEICRNRSPDLILMDVMMPEMDGYEAVRIIKQENSEKFIPVIFLTALTDDESLAECVEAGGDDFISKPFNRVILKSKISALLRLRNVYLIQQAQKAELELHAKQEQEEQLVAKKLFSNIVHSGSLSAPNLKHVISPMSIFNGDLLLAAYSPPGGLSIMLGDFTGHGLKASIGALPVSEIFYEMVAKGYSIGDIVCEINTKLKKILPTGVFCAASLVEFDPDYQTVSIWSGGVPDTIIYHPDHRIRLKISPHHMPLGILGEEAFNRSVEMHPLVSGDRIYLYTDGVIEAENTAREMFGQARLDFNFLEVGQPDLLFDQILGNLAEFREGRDQNDDTTIVEILCDQKYASEVHSDEAGKRSKEPMVWESLLTFNAQALKNIDPLPIVTQVIMEVQGLIEHRERIYTILAELFSNSLDHGILGLDSKLKKSAEGFAEYYQKRGERLASLDDGYVSIKLVHEVTEQGGDLIIEVKDSGAGFDYTQHSADLKNNTGHSGRGIPLIKALCREIAYFGDGNHVKAIYAWDYKH